MYYTDPSIMPSLYHRRLSYKKKDKARQNYKLLWRV
jgi:hypothetical protein